MQKNDSKLSMWIIAAAIVCCALPLLLLSGGLAFVTGLLFNNTFLIVLSLILVGVAIWLFFKRKNI
jgi:LPXTG-motif cell wall-anchored protein